MLAVQEGSKPAPPRGRLLLLERIGEVTAIASDAAALYGAPIEEFTRVWIQDGPHVLFVVDRVRANQPVTTVWNWLVNNRDGHFHFSQIESDAQP